MDIECLLNPVEESRNLQETSDEEIFRAVVECTSARENSSNTGGDDVDDDAPCEPCPSRCEVMNAALVINRYVQSLDDPLARKVEAVLGSLGHQMRQKSQIDMVDRKITAFFERRT
jgi:hypothetical protein